MAEFYLLGNSTYSQMFGCVIKTKGSTVVIDGGSQGDYQQLFDFLKEKAGLHVDAWFFTHAHHDHIGAFCELCYNYPEIQIDAIYHDFPPMNMLEKYGARGEWEVKLWHRVKDLFDGRFFGNVISVCKNDEFIFDDITLKALRVFNPNTLDNFVNNSSVVYRIDGAKKSILILGDLGKEGEKDVIVNCKKELLYTDYTQMAHHGQRGVSKDFYEYIGLKACIWASPDWLWNNDKGEGFDTGPWYTVRTREWAEALGVTEHIVEKDGTQKIEI